MEFENILSKIKNHDIQQEELIQWRGLCQSNILHLLATENLQDEFSICMGVLKEKNTILLQGTNELGDTPAHLAAWSGNKEILQNIVDYSQHLDYLDFYQRNIAMIVIKNNYQSLIDFCLDNTHNKEQKDLYGHNTLHYAQLFTDNKIYQHIIDKYNLISESESQMCLEIGEETEILDFVQKNKKKSLK